MPWKEESVMSQRRRIVEQMLLPGSNVREICANDGISRKTAYKWLNRYKEGGLSALTDRSREPHNQPRKTLSLIEEAVLNAHRDHPYWGPYKLKQYLINESFLNPVPSHPTIDKILKRHGCEVIKNNKSQPATKRFERSYPNELWQMDFKGSFLTKHKRCHPLTILDDYSRFSIGLRACDNEKKTTVQLHLRSIFEEYGLPEQINVDNGNPWGSADLKSLTALGVWFIKLGIKLTHSAPYHPQTNGKDERFHRSLKLEVLHQREYKNLKEMQSVFDDWRHIYNYKRPHQGIDNKVPASRYHESARKFPSQLPVYEYSADDDVRKVDPNKGMIQFRGHRYRVSKALCNEHVALKETDDPRLMSVYIARKNPQRKLGDVALPESVWQNREVWTIVNKAIAYTSVNII